MKFATTWLVTALAFGMTGCGEESGDAAQGPVVEEGEILTAVEAGKEDNFFSVTAQEYSLTGTTTLQIEASYAGASYEERLARAQELVPYRQTVIGWFLNAYTVEKSDDDSNSEYGGFKALTKNGSWEDLELTEIDELTFQFTFIQEIAGPLNLLEVLPTTIKDGERVFELQMGKVSTADMQRLEINGEWYRKAPWSGFNPETVDASRLETLELAIKAEPRSVDAWFDYEALVEDGILDIGVHFGWDYHKAYHLIHSRSTYEWLVNEEGFTSPVDGYDTLRRDSGPLTKKVLTPNGPVEIRVSLFWGITGTDTDPDTDTGGLQLERDMKTSFSKRDVIIFSGHSGPFYGFALANWRKTDEGDLDDSEIPALDMPDRYQVVLAEGCDTYALGQAFALNPAKPMLNGIDIITTTSYSNAATANAVKDFVGAFVTTKKDVPVIPRMSDLLANLDNNSYWFTTMYGVHGIDDNPQAHPWADTDALCSSCRYDSDCGPAGNKCVRLATGEQACTYECTSDAACADGFVCQPAQSGGWIRTNVCVSSRATCEAPVVAQAVLKITEVVPNPDSDLNQDGEMDVRDDEMVVITNAGEVVADLSNWGLADNVGTRFTFPGGYELLPGETATIFGGGEAELTAKRTLGLNNAGDTVRLINDRGAVIDSVSWRRARRGFRIVK